MPAKKSNKVAAVILTGDMGAAMHSKVPLPLHPLCGQPLVFYAIHTAREALGTTPILIIDKQDEQIKAVVEQAAVCILTTGERNNPLSQVLNEYSFDKGTDHLLLLRADMPLLRVDSLRQMLKTHLESPEEIDTPGTITALIMPSSRETADFFPGACCLSLEWLRGAMTASEDHDNLLDELVHKAAADGLSAKSSNVSNPDEALRIENRVDLAKAEAILRQQINERLMLKGVTIIDPVSTYIDAQVAIGRDTVIHPNTYLRGKTRIGEDCSIGPNCLILDTDIGDRCAITFSEAENAVLEEDVDIGPFAHLRRGAHLARGVHMGNYGEVKNAYLGPGTKMGHFSYIGDATIGPGVIQRPLLH